MQQKTLELLKKFQEENEIYVSATDLLTYWVVFARIQMQHEEGPHHMHHGIRFVTGPEEEGNVLVMRDPEKSDQYSAESWGPMATIDDFAKKALAQILVEKGAIERGEAKECGTSCT